MHQILYVFGHRIRITDEEPRYLHKYTIYANVDKRSIALQRMRGEIDRRKGMKCVKKPCKLTVL